MLQKIIKNKVQELRVLCSELGVKRLYVFGSAVSDTFNSESDVDFLISFADQLSVEEYTENYFTLHRRLRQLFNRKIDLLTERTLSNPYLIESIENSKELLYEA